MTSTTFSPKAGGFCQVFRSSFRQIRGVALLYTALLTVTFPLLLTLSLAQVSAAPYSLMEERSRRAMDYLNGALYFALPAFLWTFTIVFAVSLFHYLQNKRSVDLYHALPIRRETMLLGRVCAAFASLAVPFVVLFLLSLAIAALFGVQMQWTYVSEAGCAVGPLFSKLLFSLLNTLAFLCLVVFFLVCCGTVFDAAVSAIAFCGGLPLLLLLCSEYVHIALAGFGSHNIPLIVYELTNPLAAILVMFQTGATEGASPALTVWMLIYAAICLALSLFLYRKRRSEAAENAFAFPLPRIIIRFLVSACSGLLLGFLVKSLAPGFPMPISVLIGAFLAHLAVEMVYNRGVRGLWKATPAYGVCAALFLVFALICATGAFGYTYRIPAVNDVQAVEVTDVMGHNHKVSLFTQSDLGPNMYLSSYDILLGEPENVEDAVALHQSVLDSLRARGPLLPVTNDADVSFRYILKDGSVMTRSFSYSLVPESFYDETEALNTLEENVRNTIDCFYISADSFDSVFLHTYYDDTMDAVPLDEADRADLLQALQTDYLAGADSDTVWDDSSVILDLLTVSTLQYPSSHLRATLPEDSILFSLPEYDVPEGEPLFLNADSYALDAQTFPNTWAYLKELEAEGKISFPEEKNDLG